MSKTLIIFDIGSHKLEELSVLLKPGKHQLLIFIKWSIQIFIKTIIRLKFQGILRKTSKYFELLRFYFFSKKKYNLQVISIEPNPYVVHDSVSNLKKIYPVHYLPLAILGHDSEVNINLTKLNFYDHSISSSIYDRGRPINESRSIICVGIKFGALWDQLIKEKIINEDSPFILRMNSEGSELGVISDCAIKNLKPLCVIGSLGDVIKIHGVDADKKIMNLLFDMGAPYHYFKGEDPGTWYDMISIWKKYTDVYLVK
jgi:hypothetical protein